MKIKSIHLKDFKRFTDLKIEEIPETAKLVVMIGPNGCGKSSVFDALMLNAYLRHTITEETRYNTYYHRDYYIKSNESRYSFSYHKSRQLSQMERRSTYSSDANPIFDDDRIRRSIKIDFNNKMRLMEYDWDKCVRIRSSYRNGLIDSQNSRNYIERINPAGERQLGNLIQNDESVAANYWRLAFLWQERSSEIGENEEKLAKLQNEIFGELHKVLGKLFTDPQLVLKNLGNPLDGDFFQFDKGTSKRFTFQNLASGEKAALDLLLDVIVTKTEWEETIICIDEPEAHIHTKLQGQLLEELYNLIPEKSQLWIATHSIGMVRKAQDLWREDPDSVVFLDFGNRNFDEKVRITPAKPNPNFWAQTYNVALGDLSELVASEQYVFCEGEGFDAECYQNIFGNHHPEVRFISIGGKSNVINAVSKLKGNITKGAKVIGVVDMDRSTNDEIERNRKKGICTLPKKSIESYLLDDEVLTKLCEHYNNPDETQNLLTEKSKFLKKRTSEDKLKSPDDLKPIAQDIHVAAQNILKSVNLGNSKESFMRDILAKLIQPGMEVYKELHKDIFGE